MHLHTKRIFMHIIIELLLTQFTLLFLVASGDGNGGSIDGNLNDKQ